MDLRNRRLEIFRQVQEGRLSLDEASRLLAGLEQKHEILSDAPAAPVMPPETEGVVGPIAVVDRVGAVEVVVQPEPDHPILGSRDGLDRGSSAEQAERPVEPIQVNSPEMHSPVWGGWWLVTFVPGLLLVIAAANWMYEGFLAARLGWGFWLSFIPFSLGVLLVWLGWEFRFARWLYIHIQQKPGARPHEITINIPLPTGLLSWGIRQFGHFAPPLRGKDVGDFLNEMDQAVATDGPLHLFVDDDDGGQVEIWMDGSKPR